MWPPRIYSRALCTCGLWVGRHLHAGVRQVSRPSVSQAPSVDRFNSTRCEVHKTVSQQHRAALRWLLSVCPCLPGSGLIPRGTLVPVSWSHSSGTSTGWVGGSKRSATTTSPLDQREGLFYRGRDRPPRPRARVRRKWRIRPSAQAVAGER